MNLREVTIGRSRNCDIYLDQRCCFASNIHATIYYEGGQLMFKDTSTNGTMINNANVHKRTVPLHRGDVIMIAGSYPISWNQIDSFFPYTSSRHIGTVAAIPVYFNAIEEQQPNTHKWNWGAFFLPGIWGLFNGCWWLFLLQMLPVPFIIQIVAGIKGNDWAWHNKFWSSVHDFEETQNTWEKAGWIMFGISILISLLYIIFFLNI